MSTNETEPKAPAAKKTKATSITIKNGHVVDLVKWLNMPLHGDQSRVRNRFLKLIEPRYNEIETERLAKLKEITPKDEAGKPKMMPDKRTFDLGDQAEPFNEWIKERHAEEYVIDILDSNKATLRGVKDLLKKVGENLMFNSEQGESYDELCDIFETL